MVRGTFQILLGEARAGWCLLADTTVQQVRLNRTAGEGTVKLDAARLLSPGHKQRSDIGFTRSARCQCAPTDQKAQTQANTTVRTRIESTSPAGLEMPANLVTCREPKVCKRFPIRYLFFSWCNNFFHYSGTRIIQPSS